jgi:AcrR family transcriptional regulator
MMEGMAMARAGEDVDTGVHRSYRGVPAADRVAARRASLLTAGLELLGTRGVAGTRVEDVCAEAGLTRRYFYESFSSFEEFTNAVLDKVIADLTEIIVPVVAESGWRHPRPGIEAFCTTILDDPRLTRLIVVELHSGQLVSRRAELIDLAVDLWLAADPETDKDPKYLASQRLLAHSMAGVVFEVALAWVAGRIELSQQEVIDHFVRVFERITPRQRGASAEESHQVSPPVGQARR